jgi:hypothetical protein
VLSNLGDGGVLQCRRVALDNYITGLEIELVETEEGWCSWDSDSE